MIRVKTPQGCVDFDRDAEICVVVSRQAAGGSCKRRRANSRLRRAFLAGGCDFRLGRWRLGFCLVGDSSAAGKLAVCTYFDPDAYF